MAEQQESDNANAANTSASNQQSSPDWNTVSNLIGSAITNAAKISAPTKQKRDWIPIINLILTFIIAVGGVVGGFWVSRSLNIQNEQINKELDIFSHALQFAHLEVSCYAECNSQFQVKNDGPGSATNLTVTILLAEILDPWKSNIKDIGALKPVTIPFSIPKSITKTNILDLVVPNNDAYNITLDNVPPQENIIIGFIPDLKKLGLIDTHHASFDFKVYTDKPLPTSDDRSLFLYSYLASFFGMANFEINATCNICQGDTIYGSSTDSGKYITMKASSVATQSIYTTNTGSPQSVQELDGFDEITYILPHGIKPISVSPHVYVQVRNTYTSEESIEPCQPSKCNDFSQPMAP